ncbi:MAG: redoxin domain-containing protein [Bacteroidia bacterium]|nr:redoxin domain-containing protein [Bacteroidia bacterium]
MKAILLIFFLPLTLLSQGFDIRGKIHGWKDTTFLFGHYYADKNVVKDTLRLDHKGEFVFKGGKTWPGGIYLIVAPNKKFFEILIDKQQKFSIETDTSDYVGQMKIKGSDDNEVFYKYLRYLAPRGKEMEKLKKDMEIAKTDTAAAGKVRRRMAEVEKEVKAYKLQFIKDKPESFLAVIFKASQDPEIPPTPILPSGRKDSTFPYRYYKAHYWDNIPLNDDRMLRTPLFHPKLKFWFEKMMAQIPDSIVKESKKLIAATNGNKEMFKYLVYYVTFTYESSQVMGMDAVFVEMVNSYYKTGQAFWVDSTQLKKISDRANTLEPLLLGKKAKNLVLPDTSGHLMKALHDVKAKYTVLFFWEPSCGHCQKEAPKLLAFYEKNKQKGVEIYAVNIDSNKEEWTEFIRKNNLHWLNVANLFHHYYLREIFDIYSTPVIYLLDENKIIKAKRLGVDQLEGFIDHLEKERLRTEKNKPK